MGSTVTSVKLLLNYHVSIDDIPLLYMNSGKESTAPLPTSDTFFRVSIYSLNAAN